MALIIWKALWSQKTFGCSYTKHAIYFKYVEDLSSGSLAEWKFYLVGKVSRFGPTTRLEPP